MTDNNMIDNNMITANFDHQKMYYQNNKDRIKEKKTIILPKQ